MCSNGQRTPHWSRRFGSGFWNDSFINESCLYMVPFERQQSLHSHHSVRLCDPPLQAWVRLIVLHEGRSTSSSTGLARPRNSPLQAEPCLIQVSDDGAPLTGAYMNTAPDDGATLPMMVLRSQNSFQINAF